MPELPEVETVAIALRQNILGQRIKSLQVESLGERALGGKLDTAAKISGQLLTHISRVGKFLVLHLEGEQGIVVHLRMTGRFYYQATDLDSGKGFVAPHYLVNDRSGKPDKYVRLALEVEQGTLHFSDKRRFGTFHYVENIDDYPGLNRLGPDALSEQFNADYFYKRTRKISKNIYATLMDQAIVAGLGNIYVAEVLAENRVHPLLPTNQLTRQQAESIVDFVKELLSEAIKFQGTTFSDFQTTTGKSGGFQEKLKVYGKKETVVAGKKYAIEKLRIGGRGVYYIPELQSL